MDGILFAFAVAAIAVIVFWEIRNDKVAPDGPMSGLLAMPSEPPGRAIAGRPSSRPASTGRR